MSVSWSLQQVLYSRLKADATVASLISGRIFDGPVEKVTYPYMTFGASDFTPEDADCIVARSESVQIDVWSNAQDGKREAKLITDAICRCLQGFAAEMTTGALVDVYVELVRVMDDPDPGVKHGIVQVSAMIDDEGL